MTTPQEPKERRGRTMNRDDFVRRNEDGTLDDVYFQRPEYFRAEEMEDDVWWFAIEVDGKRIAWSVAGPLFEIEPFPPEVTP